MTGHIDTHFHILLVEDSQVDAHLTRAALEENRFAVSMHHVTDGIEALDYLRQQGQNFTDGLRPDLILLDLNMPRMNGREFLTAMKADPNLSDIPVVILTTSDVEQDVIASYKLGAAGYVTKPVDLEQFIHAINQLGNYWFKLVRVPHS
ncbi:response regulator [Magnetospirillum gryphiswaldense]|uniref:Response regulator rcp1 n=2 Tax=Magnetospirillum gryphiswaldense TaxID=55518 RepID=V6EZN1_MAGGM|nr:response regulator [Magnetospirillum gryphiswaldense]AVM73296.1 Response regulator rcp1 [Magnetospirillum gryphiswaldense MSR-1]AVM77199.1 Response regulator rcp1 [Magnetospirillum gryphiswaldense]CAM74595.1 Response regulator receiver domain protein (CheY) [Magnetospirillum gryphiswaldense MSR-1]CDK98664.1 Response regulator rcp1 [Magnetospirillum gryphiswaldense MSR-1 v2]